MRDRIDVEIGRIEACIQTGYRQNANQQRRSRATGSGNDGVVASRYHRSLESSIFLTSSLTVEADSIRAYVEFGFSNDSVCRGLWLTHHPHRATPGTETW